MSSTETEHGETKYAEGSTTEMARERVAEEKKAADRARAEAAERLKGKPTPTQEENDHSAHGAHILTHEHDGSVDPAVLKRQFEADHPAAGYQTRQAQSQTRSAPPRPTPPGKSE